ncbi:hypothetical protein Z517_06599 [Fonsecaea pedrosoi CBS 271.37]|uniref:Unplaced genomic scaffold supercont1.4, whole genome shotgun sequence n=1 Tax=Fonsecaea pedrosoi CBS 271.37 TaxID=1442368 RepID=A0A0D2H5W3_9EURO|nr:uncharacterized protein Z517_06599 [Fonsecaea pedrosoi CBS 271.37]KIW79984.1 hypothetical protein Z517_06599 [Fonsecaea pedrosoi CBS 271.37]
MPKSNSTIAAPLREALEECFRLVRPELRRHTILVGGAASIAHSSVLVTEDVDVAAPSSALTDIWKGILAGAPNLSFESDGKISFDAPRQDIRIRVDLLEIGNGCIERIHVTEPFFEGSVASVSDLLRLRAVTVVDRGSDGEVEDFQWLLSRVACMGQLLPELGDEELKCMRGAGESSLGKLDRLVLGAVLSVNN